MVTVHSVPSVGIPRVCLMVPELRRLSRLLNSTSAVLRVLPDLLCS